MAQPAPPTPPSAHPMRAVSCWMWSGCSFPIPPSHAAAARGMPDIHYVSGITRIQCTFTLPHAPRVQLISVSQRVWASGFTIALCSLWSGGLPAMHSTRRMRACWLGALCPAPVCWIYRCTRQLHKCVQHLHVLPTIHLRSGSWQQCQAHAFGMHDSHASHNTEPSQGVPSQPG